MDDTRQVVVVTALLDQEDGHGRIGSCETPGYNTSGRTTAGDDNVELMEIFREVLV